MALRQPFVRSSLRTFLNNQFSNLSNAPVLVVSSQARQEQQILKPVNDLLQKFNFIAEEDLGLNIVHTHISSAFPTREDVCKTEELLERTGASTVVGIGSGVAVDLVKALPQHVEQKILMPATSAAVFACNTDAALLLEAHDNSLIMKSAPQRTAILAEVGTIKPTEDSIAACHSILLDASYREPERVPELEAASHALQTDPVLGMLATATHLSTGLGNTNSVRSAPLVLASALIPTFFPTTNIFSFWASLLPGLAHLHGHKMIGNKKYFPSLAERALQPVSVETLLQHVRHNQALTSPDVADIDESYLEQILSVSLNR